MPRAAGRDSMGSGRLTRRGRRHAGDAIKPRTVKPELLHRRIFPPDVTPSVDDSRPPTWDPDPDHIAHEQGEAEFPARGDHNHDYTYPDQGETRVLGTADADSVYPFENAAEGPNPDAGPTQFHMRTATWDQKLEVEDRVLQGKIEVWTRTSRDGGLTWREPRLRAVVSPNVRRAFYEVHDEVHDPGFYVTAPVVQVRVVPIRHDRSAILKLVRADWVGKIDSAFLGDGAAGWYSGAASPETVLAATVGSGYRDTTNGDIYVKATGTGNTGWQIVYRVGGLVVIPVANGGTGGATADAARSNLVAQGTAQKDAASGYAGLDSSSRTTKGVKTTDYLIVDLATKGLVIKDAAGTPHYWLLGISTLGALTTSDLGTTAP